MLSYFLAIAIAIISMGLYLTAFLSPKIHRKDDFLWSGLGLFYALILWMCNGRITGALLLGQLAAVSVILAFIWETRQLRKIITSQEGKVKLEGVSILDVSLNLAIKLFDLTRKQPTPTNIKTQSTETKTSSSSTADINKTETQEKITTEEISIPTQTTDSIPEKENENQELEEIITIEENKKQTEDKSILIEEESKITPSEDIEIEGNENNIINGETFSDDEENIEESLLDGYQNNSPSDNQPSEVKKKGFFSQILANLRKPLSFGKKSTSSSQEETSENTNNQDEAKLDEIAKEEAEIITPFPSEVDISPEENAKEIEDAINDLDLDVLQGSIPKKSDVSIKSNQESSNIIEVDHDADTYEIIDTDENADEKEIKENEVDFDLEFAEEIKVETTSLFEGENEIELSDNLDLEEDLDDFSEEIIIEKNEKSLNYEINPIQVAEEDKISMLTDLMEENDKKDIEQIQSKLNEFLDDSESDLDLDISQDSTNKTNENTENTDNFMDDIDELFSKNEENKENKSQ